MLGTSRRTAVSTVSVVLVSVLATLGPSASYADDRHAKGRHAEDRDDDDRRIVRFVGCPAGQAIQGINFATRKLACVAVADTTALQAQVSALQAQLGTAQGSINTLQSQVGTLQSQVGTLQSQVATLQSSGGLAQALAPYVSVQAGDIGGLKGPHIVFSGANVHIQSGSGATDDLGTLTGWGNLVVGYDEPRNAADGPTQRGGSHNLIVGGGHNFLSYGGFVAGRTNTIIGVSNSISGGLGNTASGSYASISGGSENTAAGEMSSVSGGLQNAASAMSSSVLGGLGNKTLGQFSSVSGGEQNAPVGFASSVLGGLGNKPSDRDSHVP